MNPPQAMTATIERQISSDLDKIDLVLAIGSKSAKRKAMAHRKACFAELKKMSIKDGTAGLSDEEILAQLGI
jgi:hypothetical protein